MKILRVVSIIIFISFLVISCGNGGGGGDVSNNNNGAGGSFVATLDMTQDDIGMAEVAVFDETFERGNGTPVSESRMFIGAEGTATIKLMNDRISSAIVSVNGQVIFNASDFNLNVDYLEKEIMLLDGLNILDVLLRSKPGGKLSVQIIMKDTCVPSNPPDEVCDGLDNDCNGQIDDGIEGIPITCGIGECKSSGVRQCINGGTVDTCTPGNPSTEICDGKDNDCDGKVDEGVKNTYYRDEDIDLYGDPARTAQACSQPSGYVTDNTDCNDFDESINPGENEVCDERDNNCDGQIDEGCYVLTITTTNPSHTNVTSTPGLINCGLGGSVCSEIYTSGTKVTLSYSCPLGGFFWTGDADCNDNVVTMNRDITCNAVCTIL